MTKTIGVLGGMGSFATHHFIGNILRIAEPDEFRIIVDYATHIPSRTLAVKDKESDMYGEVMDGIEAGLHALDVHMGADVLAVPCNSAHYWYPTVLPSSHTHSLISHDWLNMIEVVSNVVKSRGFSRPLILGGYVTVEKRLYSKYLPGAVYPRDRTQDNNINGLIYDIKGGREIVGPLHLLANGITHDCVILACTELSIAYAPFNHKEMGRIIIDSSYEYAKATVEYARGEG